MKSILLVIISLIAVSPVQAISLSDEVKNCKAAWDQAKKKKYEEAYRLTSSNKCPLTQRYLLWEKLRAEDITSPFKDYQSFINKHGSWPWMPQILRKAESALPDNLAPQETIAWFTKHEPKTGYGFKLYLKALKAAGNQTKLVQQAKHYWQNFDFTAERQQTFLKNYGNLLSLEDHKIRLNRLFTEEKNEQIERMIPLIPQEHRPEIVSRLKILMNHASPEAIIHQAGKITPELIYEHIRWHRKQDNLNGAHLFNQVDPLITTAPHWAKERLYFSREAFNQGQYQLAYDVLKGHPFKSGRELEEAEWFSGWLCLRFLNNPQQALVHFKKYKESVNQADSMTKAAYWLGRTYEVLGQADEAKKSYQSALLYKGTYYAHLSHNKLNKVVKITYDKEKPIDQTAWKKFQNHEFVQIARLLKTAGQPSEALPFLFMLGKRVKSQSEKRLAIHLIQEVLKGYTIFAAKDIGFVENRILPWLYPLRKIGPRALQQGVDSKLMHAIMRQESGFHDKAVSPAGASGLMQVMPATAEKIAKQNNYKHKKEYLTNDPDYNVLLGSHFLKEMLDRYKGVFVLAIAAYNAGPRPVGQWIERYGNPGNPDVDIVDWIESIPYKETRGYVKSVLANYYVYTSLENNK